MQQPLRLQQRNLVGPDRQGPLGLQGRPSKRPAQTLKQILAPWPGICRRAKRQGPSKASWCEDRKLGVGRLLAGPAPPTVWSPLPPPTTRCSGSNKADSAEAGETPSLVVPTDPWFSKQWYMVSWLGWAAGLAISEPSWTLAPPCTEQ